MVNGNKGNNDKTLSYQISQTGLVNCRFYSCRNTSLALDACDIWVTIIVMKGIAENNVGMIYSVQGVASDYIKANTSCLYVIVLPDDTHDDLLGQSRAVPIAIREQTTIHL